MKDSSGEIFHKTSSAPSISAFAQKGPDATWRVFFQLFDQRGDTTALTNHLGTLVMTQSYHDFGAQKNTPSLPYGFLGSFGRLHIPQTGLDLLGARHYNPRLGRFLSKDPIEGGSSNPYEYGGGDPQNKVDPTGRFFFGLELVSVLCWLSGLECSFGGAPPPPPRPPSPAPPSSRNGSSPKLGDPFGFREGGGFSWKGLGKKLVVARILFQTHPGLAYFGFKYGEKVDLGRVFVAPGGEGVSARTVGATAVTWIGCGAGLVTGQVIGVTISYGRIYTSMTAETLGQLSPYIENEVGPKL